MKKILLLLAISMLAFSCQDNDPDYEGNMRRRVDTFTIRDQDWTYYNEGGLNGFLHCSFRWNTMDNYRYNNSSVVVYVEYDGRKHPLPFIRHMEELNSPTTVARWTETTEFEYAPGYIHFYFRTSDFDYPAMGTMRFHAVTVW